MKGIIQALKAHWFFMVCLLVPGVLMLYFARYNEMCEGGADNIWHYYFTKYSYTYPDFFLHHWGKPLFILLGGPFAQFGFYGLKVFNILVGLLTTIVCYRLLGLMNVKFRWTIAPLLLFSPLYFIVLQSALTEPLFSLLLISAVYFYFREKYIASALIISFLMFSRSEGTFLLLYFLFLFVFQRRWKAIPFLFAGFLIYAVVGWFAGHGFWWFFTENPYKMESPYGHGGWSDILERYKAIWGVPFLVAMLLACVVLCISFFRNKGYLFWKPLSESGKVFYLVFVPAFLFTAFHVYVWRFGLCGSAGLERVLACVLPCMAVLTVWAMNKVFMSRFPKGLSFVIVAVFLYLHIYTPFEVFGYPLGSYGSDRAELEAARWFKTIAPKDYILFYAHPNIVFNLDRDPFDKDRNREEFAYDKSCHFDRSRPIYLFWDSMFTESSCGVSIKDVEACGYTKLKEFSDGDFRLLVYELKAQ
ncbi:MAG: hypothetical protein JST26_19765 [Bacteroidetes bacterium]|nr:hypothetical protein [Bacteroidota bacterium]